MSEQIAISIASTMWSIGFRSARDVLKVARYSMGDTGQALVCLQIMASGAPPRR
ncbi:MAG: hypothetical protein QXQ48_08225 [Nitrososphaerota archaeon]